MADHKEEETERRFYSEILTPSELFAARARNHKIPVRGQKDFIPDNSDEQRRQLEQSLEEHWSLISEERVERLGNLVKGLWLPDDQVVELQSPAGKFWQTMGFSANGKQYLLPEEALYLMECGSVQVFEQELPMSIQDGYETFLSSRTLSLQQYQVFAHLKRLGFVVLRFEPSSEPLSYEQQLNIRQSRDKAGRPVKRKRCGSPDPRVCSSRTEDHDESVARRIDCPSGSACNGPQLTPSPQTIDTQTASSSNKCRGRTWWMTDASGGCGFWADRHSGSGSPCLETDHHSSSVSSRWDSSICLPDLGSSEQLSRCLPSPDPALLPGALVVGVCDVSCWVQRINLRNVAMSKEKKREQDSWKWNERSRHLHDVNRDKEVQRCRNWAEYWNLMARRQGRRSGQPAHLWNKKVTPLHNPKQPVTTGELLDKISVVKSSHFLEEASSFKGSDEWRISFNVYQPDSVADFKKSKPGKPDSRMCVCSFDGPVPDLRTIKLMAYQGGESLVVFAVVDHGDISFYTFKDFQLPTDVFP